MRRVFGVVLLAAALPAAAAITGFVVDSSGAPIATARVDAYRAVPQYFAMMLIRKSAELHPIASAKTDAKGTFALDLAGHGVADIQVSADGYAPADVFAAYDDNVGTITLSSATNVEGKVVANGKPVADAAVIAYPAEGMPTITKTNAQGGFRLPDPKPWAQYVIVAHPDFAWVAHPPANLNFVLEAGRDVKGKVLDAKGAPVAGADVNVDNISFAKTGEDGSFIVKHVPARSNVITARTTTGASSMRLPSGAPTLKLRPVAHVKGVVRDSSKQPLAGLAVMIGAEEAGGFDVAYTDAKGAFDLSAARAKYNLTADGFGVYEIENAEIDGRAGDIRQDLVAQRQRYVEGVVKKSDGSVVQGALLGTSEQDGSAQMQVVPTAVMTAVRTGADGRFRIPRAGMTNFRIVALKSGLPPAESAPITDATTDRAIVITVPDGVEIRGTVVDADSKPISGVSINPIIGYGAERMLNAEGERQDEAAWTTTKDDGTFIGRLNPGSLALNFARKGFVATQQMIEVAPSMRPIAVTLTKGVALRGRVARADGTPAPEIPVGVGERYVMSEADGSFAIEDIETGDYVLRFGATGTQQKNVHAPAEDIRLVLAGTRKITGRVTDSATGAPVEQFFVWVRGEKDQVPPESVASPTGEFSIDAPETAVKLNVSASGYAPAKDIAVAVSPAAPVAVSLSRGRSIRGRVADASDQPLGDVEIARTSGDYDFTGERSLHSNPDGTWEINGIGFDDEVALSFSKEGYVAEQRKLRPGREDAKLDVTMRHGIVVSGRVIDSSGNGVADISVGASSAAHGAGYESASTDKTGAFKFAGLAPGRYDFSADTNEQGLKGAVKDVDIEKTHEITIRMEKHPTAIISGHVAGLDNTALMRSITAKNEQGESQNAMIDAGGNFRIEAPSGLVEVTAQYGGRRGNRSSRPVTVDAPAGSERRVDLVFPEQVKLRGAVTRAGAPVGNVTIAFGGSGMESASASTNAEGIYETVIDPGEYDVTISDGQRELPFRQHISVTSEARVDFGIESNAVKITVVDAETAQPLAGATVNVAHGGETHEAGSAVTGADGSTTMEVAAADALTITASLRGYANGVADLAAGSGTPVLLRLVRSPGAIVRLVDRRDGRTLTGYVIARDDAGRVVASKSEFDPDGTVTLALAPGRYRFSGSAEGYGSQTLLAEVPSDEVQIALPRGGSIAIRSASDLRGSARLIQPNGEEYVRCWCNGIARIAIDGHMTIVDRISPGPYTLEVTLGAAKPRTVPITVVEGQTLPVPID